ncbi:hypothetical protein PM082_001145 [Marasmius tenuissimus]|nr:hypothetical protein PM082_001145 [Marasmius tenuissimus]
MDGRMDGWDGKMGKVGVWRSTDGWMGRFPSIRKRKSLQIHLSIRVKPQSQFQDVEVRGSTWKQSHTYAGRSRRINITRGVRSRSDWIKNTRVENTPRGVGSLRAQESFFFRDHRVRVDRETRIGHYYPLPNGCDSEYALSCPRSQPAFQGAVFPRPTEKAREGDYWDLRFLGISYNTHSESRLVRETYV